MHPHLLLENGGIGQGHAECYARLKLALNTLPGYICGHSITWSAATSKQMPTHTVNLGESGEPAAAAPGTSRNSPVSTAKERFVHGSKSALLSRVSIVA